MPLRYSPATMAGQASGSSVPSSETDLVIVKDLRMLQMSQLSIYLQAALGSATKVAFGYYFSFDEGVSWYKVPRKDSGTNFGDLVDNPSYLDTNSPVIFGGSAKAAVDNIPTSGATWFKVTGTATGAVSGAWAVTVMARDN